MSNGMAQQPIFMILRDIYSVHFDNVESLKKSVRATNARICISYRRGI